jgi:hypothetical protein
MTFNDAIASAADVWFGTGITEAITYNSVSIRGHVQYADGGDRHAGKFALLEVLKTDVPSPAYRDIVVYGGVTFYVVKGPNGQIVHSGDQISWTLFLSTNERPVY